MTAATETGREALRELSTAEYFEKECRGFLSLLSDARVGWAAKRRAFLALFLLLANMPPAARDASKADFWWDVVSSEFRQREDFEWAREALAAGVTR